MAVGRRGAEAAGRGAQRVSGGAGGVDRDDAHERIRRERRLREFADREGAWNLHGAGAGRGRCAGAVGARSDRRRAVQDRAGRRSKEPREAYAFDALVELARRRAGGGSEWTRRSRRRRRRGSWAWCGSITRRCGGECGGRRGLRDLRARADPGRRRVICRATRSSSWSSPRASTLRTSPTWGGRRRSRRRLHCGGDHRAARSSTASALNGSRTTTDPTGPRRITPARRAPTPSAATDHWLKTVLGWAIVAVPRGP